MKTSARVFRLVIFTLITLIASSLSAQDYLSGKVFKGNQGDETSPLSGVTVRLYGSNNASSLGSQISSTTTNGSGWYQLLATSGYEYYTIEEVDLSGYQSIAATSVDGTVITSNRIRYSAASEPLSDQTKTGNKFWDKPLSVPNNPPVADANGPYTGLAGQPVHFDGSGSWDPDGDALTYAWDFDMDGQYDDGTGGQPAYTWNSTYAGNIKLRVTDSHGDSDTDLAYVDIAESQSQTGSVQGIKFNDKNKNGTKDSGEEDLENWRFYLDINQNNQYDAGEPYDYTSHHGTFQIFAAPGTYSLREELQAGWTASLYEEYVITITENQVTTKDFGNYEVSGEDEFDYGDAPPSYNLAQFFTVTSDLYLGSSVDGDPGPQPHGNALGDDEDGNDDEDGIFFTGALIPGQNTIVQVTIGAANRLEQALLIYLDIDRDGQWSLSTENILQTSISNPGKYTFSIQVPSNASQGVTFARAILYDTAILSPWGVYYGEVEDYEVEIGAGGSITVVKDANPKDDTSFYFEGDFGSFSLQDPSDNTITFTGMASGFYYVQEMVPNGWISSSIQFVGDMDNLSEIAWSQDRIWIDYDAGEEITVYFINEKVENMDYGDAPDPSYPTLLAGNGARHIAPTDLYLGSSVDTELDGQPTYSADGDNQNGITDEDGVSMSPFIAPGQTVSVTVTASAAGVLNAWCDINIDGDWADPGEHFLAAQSLVAGANTLSFTVPANAVIGPTYARFRFSSVRDLSYDGDAPDGEVEDYALEIKEPEEGTITIIKEASPADDTPFLICTQYTSGFFNLFCGFLKDPSSNKQVILNPGNVDKVSEGSVSGWTLADIQVTGDTDNGSVINLSNRDVDVDWDTGENIIITFKNEASAEGDYDFGDAPHPAFPTLLSQNGARHKINPQMTLGQLIDRDPDGYASPLANGDDLVSPGGQADDEDGINFTSKLIAGQNATVDVEVSAAGYLNAWIDFNGNQNWGDSGEQICKAFPIPAGTTTITYPVPAGIVPGMGVFARFRFSSTQGLSFTGAADDGEVEDYYVLLGEDIERDYGDAPSGFPDASHELGGPWLGGLGDKPDSETGSQNDAQSKGDDLDGNDDEDGIYKAAFIINKWGDVQYQFVTGTSGLATIGFWVDFNRDGDWDDPGESVSSSTSVPLPAGIPYHVGMVWSLPAATQAGKTTMRVRIYEGTNVNLSHSGDAGPGEVEDYEVEIKTDGPPPPDGYIISGYKFNDLDGDGSWLGTEPPLAGWTIWLDANQNGVEDAGDLYDLTDATGQFSFSGLTTGQYVLGEHLKTGWIQTCPGGLGTYTVTVNAGSFNLPVLFGNQQENGGSSGKGAVKWLQPPLFDPASNDTTCYWGWYEPSIFSETYVTDDWFCYDPRPVTGIQWWGSYAEWDSIVPPDDGPQYFHVCIWTDAPDPYFRHPEELVKEWFLTREQLQETYIKCHSQPDRMDKPLSCFRYTFDIPKDGWFYQEGDSTIYWLHVAAAYEDMPERHDWGWLTRERYFHADAIRILQPQETHPGTYFEEGYIVADFCDMAFVLYTDEYDSKFDFGDAPDPGYGTTASRNGAKHLIDSSVYLGERLDEDIDGQPHFEATGDDNDGLDDEDGLEIIYPAVIGGYPELQITASSTGFLNIWIDLNRDGEWTQLSDHIITDAEVMPETQVMDIPALQSIEPGDYMARIRFSTEPGLWVRGLAMNGEVEDYLLTVDMYDAIHQQDNSKPETFELYQNFPNPFNPETAIRYDIPENARVEITVYNIKGQKVIDLVHRDQQPGAYQVTWRGRDASGRPVSSGLYLYTIRADDYFKTMKLIYLQ